MHLDFIYDEMQHFQSEREPAPGDALNGENLPYLLSKMGIRVFQYELGNVSDLLTLFHIETVEELTSKATYECLNDIRNAWKKVLPVGQEPNALMIINVLGQSDSVPSADEIEDRVQSFKSLYNTLRGRLGTQPTWGPSV